MTNQLSKEQQNVLSLVLRGCFVTGATVKASNTD